MVISKETLTDLKEKYEKATKLVEEDSKQDPPTDPYRSHYAARDILTEIMENLKNSIHSEEDDSENRYIYKVILSFVYRDLGRISVFTEEISSGEKYLKNCLDLISEYKLNPEAIISYIGASNELVIIWSNRQDLTEAKKYLEQSETVYKEFKQSGKSAMSITDIFGTRDEIEKDKGPKELEKFYTLTTFYMAQVLGHMGELYLSAQYCNLTLRRQLEAKDYDPIDWALNAATLSQYYITPGKFTKARHHLAAATYVLEEYEKNMITPEMSEDAKAAARETYDHRYADIARCWAKYGIALITASKERLLSDNDEPENETTTNEFKAIKDMSNLNLQENTDSSSCRFTSLDIDIYESNVTDKYCLTFDDAKAVYLFVVMWLDKAKEYYTADTEATEYSKIILDYADLYKQLAFFDDDPSNQSKLHKRRADQLEDLMKILNPTYYLAIFRECWYECGLAYSAMLDIKLDALSKLKFNESPTPHQLHKINTLCDKAISHFKSFIDSYKQKDSEILQSNLTNEEMQAVLYSYFYVGRLFYKIITPDKARQLSNLQNSLKFYKLFITGCDENAEAAKNFYGEIGVCKEMVSLLPLKIQKTVNEMKEEA